MNENWKPIPGFEGRYEVSDLGRVKRLESMQRCKPNGVWAERTMPEQIMANNRINSGYHVVHFMVDHVRSAHLVHRLVVSAFIDLIPKGMTVNHMNCDKTDNRLCNLEVVSYTDNHRHAVANGLNTAAVRVRGTHLNTGAVCDFPSIAEAAHCVAGARRKEAAIRRCVRGTANTAYGHTWEAVL